DFGAGVKASALGLRQPNELANKFLARISSLEGEHSEILPDKSIASSTFQPGDAEEEQEEEVMDSTAIVAIVLIVALVLLAGAWSIVNQRKRESELREQFGPEYDRAVLERGGKSAAMKDLDARRERVARLNIVELSPEDQRRYAEAWRI